MLRIVIYNKMTQAISQIDDLSFQSPNQEDNDDIFVDQIIHKRVIDRRKPIPNSNHGQVIMKSYDFRPQRRKPERWSQTLGYDWLLLYRLNVLKFGSRKYRQQMPKNLNIKTAFRYEPAFFTNNKQMLQISQTKKQTIKNRTVVNIATQYSQSDFIKNEDIQKDTQFQQIHQIDTRFQYYQQQTSFISLPQLSVEENKSQTKRERTKLAQSPVIQEKDSPQESQMINIPFNKISSESTKPKKWQQQFDQLEVISLRLPPKTKNKKKRQKQPKNQPIIITSNKQQEQQTENINNKDDIFCSNYELDQTLNRAFLFGQSWLYDGEQLEQGYATADLTIRFKGPILFLKIKTFSLILGEHKIQIKLGRRDRNDNYECCEFKYKKSLQIVQNVYQGKRQYLASYKQANFKLFLLKLPAKLQSFFEVGPEDLGQLKIEIDKLSITCFCKRKFQTCISSSVTCDNCSLPSTIIVDYYSIK